ncbi:hypothetical protein [Cryobacterium sp. SO1]|uniref:hypothetical protein n=1 Tax=Cryobacterium sp. SO1 TaxID=1897061 RepID=UPI00102304A3|nr:hypothetical protein [Cryobacterium sp. SO1]RZI35422.1 hypothetical protein BJQ95_02185 [Cryobacterium sp. SO1]
MTDQNSPADGPDNEPTIPLNSIPATTTPRTSTPLNSTPLKGTPLESTPPAAADPLPRRRPLFATIFWGALMLALAAFMAARELVPGSFDLVTWLLTAIVGIGLLLVVAGIAAAARRAG